MTSTMRLALLGGLLSACGGAPAGGLKPDGPPPDEKPAAPTLPEPGVYLTPGLPDYGARAALPATEPEQGLRVALGRPLVPPPALACAAREYAARFAADGHTPGASVLAALSAHCGLWAPPAFARAATGKDIAALTAWAAELAKAARPTVLAVGAVEGPGEQVTAALLGLDGAVQLDPVPRVVQPGARITLSGRLLVGTGPLIALTEGAEPGAAGVARQSVDITPTGAFSMQVTVPDDAFSDGRAHFQVELLKEDGRFLRPLALTRLRAAPEKRYQPAPPPPIAPVEAARVRQTALETLNAARASLGQRPLGPVDHLNPLLDEWLSRLGQGETTGQPPSVVDPDGRPYVRMRYTFAAGPGGGEAVKLLLSRPHGRQALLNPADDQVAVGVRPFDGGGGADLVLVTLQGFAAQAPQVSRVVLKQKLDEARAALNHPALQGDEELDALATGIAGRALSGDLPWPQVLQATMKSVGASGRVQGAVGAGAFVVARPEEADFSQEPNALDPAVTRVGIGAAAGPLPGDGALRYIVVYVVAEAMKEGR